jgi:hypothetical protein
MLSYLRPLAGGPSFLTFWFQCSIAGWELHSGSQFTLEFQESSDPQPGHGTRSCRFIALLTADEREQVRLLQNEVIKKLRRPPPDHWAHTLNGDAKKWYFAGFDLVSSPYQEQDDVWMRYVDQADVRRWADFHATMLPRLIDRFTAKADTAKSGA